MNIIVNDFIASIFLYVYLFLCNYIYEDTYKKLITQK